MKLQITFDITNLEKATEILSTHLEKVDSFEIGSLLLFKYGEKAILSFREIAEDITLIADAKIVDHAKETTSLLLGAGADWITVMAGTKKSVIHSACTNAHNMGKKVMINMLDASSAGQAALEAKSLGGDALIFHYEGTEEESTQLQENWEMVKGNTTLPIYIKMPITSENIEKILPLEPSGLIISLTDANIDTATELINSIRSDETE